MTNPDRAFRDYATRVSFNLSFSRNQIACLRHLAIGLECYRPGMSFVERCEAEQDAGDIHISWSIVGFRALRSMGLVDDDPRWVTEQARLDAANAEIKRKGLGGWAIRKYEGPTYKLTPAGEHVVELLRIAGLIPKAAANTNKKKKRKAA